VAVFSCKVFVIFLNRFSVSTLQTSGVLVFVAVFVLFCFPFQALVMSKAVFAFGCLLLAYNPGTLHFCPNMVFLSTRLSFPTPNTMLILIHPK